jgi:hypothetical protein
MPFRSSSWLTRKTLISLCFRSALLINWYYDDYRVMLSIPICIPTALSQSLSRCGKRWIQTPRSWSFSSAGNRPIPSKSWCWGSWLVCRDPRPPRPRPRVLAVLAVLLVLPGFAVARQVLRPRVSSFELLELSIRENLSKSSSPSTSAAADNAAIRASLEDARRKAWRDKLIIWAIQRIRHRLGSYLTYIV